jgi:flagellar hook-length control protein FliK
MKGGENMSNLSINPAVVIPSFQAPEDFSTVKTDNYQSDTNQSSFSKTLADVVYSKRNQQQDVSAPLKEERAPQKETSLEQRQAVSKEPQRTEQKEALAAAVKEPESKPTQSDSQQTSNSEQSQPEQPDDSKEKVVDPKAKQATNTVDATTTVSLLAQIATDLQPLITDVPVTAIDLSDTVSTATEGLTTIPTAMITDSKQAADDTNAKVALPQLNSSQITASMQNILQSAVIAEQVSSPVKQTEAIAQSAPGVLAAVQTLENLGNPKVTDAAKQTQKDQPITASGQAKNNDSEGPKFSDLLNSKAVEVKAGDSVVKPGEGQKGLVNPNLLPAADSKDPQLSTADAKTPFLSDTAAANQVTGNVGKPQTVNLPLIQTQLSVSSSTDKVRSDIALVAANNQQQAPVANSEVTASTTNHINRDDLFAQIVEKAKVLVNNGHSEMEISLKPEHLGKLQLKISVVDQVVTAKFMAESQQVKEVIETHLNQLRRNLQDTGVQVDQLMVSVGQQNNGSGFEQSSHFQGELAGNNGSNTSHQENSNDSLSDHPAEKPSLRDTVIDYVA